MDARRKKESRSLPVRSYASSILFRFSFFKFFLGWSVSVCLGHWDVAASLVGRCRLFFTDGGEVSEMLVFWACDARRVERVLGW